VKWQRVQQFVEPVACRAVDVRVLTQVLPQRLRVGGVVGVEVDVTVQRHHNYQTLLALHYNVVMKCNVELLQTVGAVNKRSTDKLDYIENLHLPLLVDKNTKII